MLQRDALEASPLADLHELATEKGLESFRRLRKADLIDRLLGEGGDDAKAPAKAKPAEKAEKSEAPARGGREPRGGSDDDEREGGRTRSRGRSRRRGGDEDVEERTSARGGREPGGDEEAEERTSTRGERGGRGRGERNGGGDRDRGERNGGGDRDRGERNGGEDREEREIEGVVEVLANGTAFVRVNSPEQSDDDVYVSAAQVRRCELTSGDRITGPYRQPRRSEKYPSLVRVEKINGRPADEVTAEVSRFEDQPATHPSERFELGADDVTLKAIEWLAPIGRGSRVVVHGAAHAGKTEALRLLAGALKAIDGVELQLVLAGARPEEVGAWKETGIEPAATALLGSSLDAQNGAIDRALDQARRVAKKGGDAVVLIDSLAELAPHVARRVLATARNLAGEGSVTIIASAYAPVGGETTLIALDANRPGGERFDLTRSSTLRADLLVGAEGAKAIAEARRKAAGA